MQSDLKHYQFLHKFTSRLLILCLCIENVALSKPGEQLIKKQKKNSWKFKGSQGEHAFNMIVTSPIWLKKQDLLQ